jgi:hypothetical protein
MKVNIILRHYDWNRDKPTAQPGGSSRQSFATEVNRRRDVGGLDVRGNKRAIAELATGVVQNQPTRLMLAVRGGYLTLGTSTSMYHGTGMAPQ